MGIRVFFFSDRPWQSIFAGSPFCWARCVFFFWYLSEYRGGSLSPLTVAAMFQAFGDGRR